MAAFRKNFGLSLAVLLAVSGCGKHEEAAEPPRPALTLVVASRPALDMVLSGVVQPQVQSPMGFRVLGRMIARPVKVGDRVVAGQMLAAVDPLAFEMAARSAAASLASARAQFDNAASTEGRQAALLAKQTASQAAFDSAEQARAATQATMQQAEANLAKAREQLSYAVLKADYDGIVTATYADVGQTVAPGQPVVALAEPSRRDAVIDTPLNVVEALFLGERFVGTLQLDPDVSAKGIVREIAPLADSATRFRRVKIALENPQPGFRLGSTIFAHLEAGADSAIRLPAGAVLGEGENTRVFVVDPKTSAVASRAIAVAPDRDGGWIVRGGLRVGERVVVAGLHRLKEGQIVKVAGSEAP